MGRRIKPTHLLTAYRYPAGSDSYTDDPTDTDPTVVAEDEPVRFWGRGGLVRLETGEFAERGPDATGNGDLAESVSEGDVIELEAVDDSHRSYSGLEITHVREVYGRGPTPVKTRIRLDGV